MKAFYGILILICLWATPVRSQSYFYSLANDTSSPTIQDCTLLSPDTLSRSSVTLYYELRYVTDTLSDMHYQNRVAVQTDGKLSKYFVLRRHVQDCVGTGIDQLIAGVKTVVGAGGRYVKTPEEEQMHRVAGDEDILNSEIWRSFDKGILTERLHDYVQRNHALEYEEPTPAFHWTIKDERDTLCGYPCQTAEMKFRGRRWIALFSPELPLNVGSWKFCGLPGAILKICDTQNQYNWECVEIAKQVPIVYYIVPTQRLTKNQCDRYLQTVHRSPLSILGRGGDAAYYSRGSKKFLDDSWTIPYNPIEFE